MVLSGRLETIVSALDETAVFADVGCDHGYCSREMLKRGKCRFAYLTDLSAESLKKADDLLKSEFAGRYRALVANGLAGVPFADEVLIAGMGGEEMISILSAAPFSPEKLILQPMKNAEKVRAYLIKHGYKPIIDYTFADGKFYDLIKAERGTCSYSEDELRFGRDNLLRRGEDFVRMIEGKIAVLTEALPKMSEEEKEKTKKTIRKYKEVIA